MTSPGRGNSWTTVWTRYEHLLDVIEEQERPDIIVLPSGLKEKSNEGNSIYLGHGTSHSTIRTKIDEMKMNCVIITCSCLPKRRKKVEEKENECVATDFPSGNVISVRCGHSKEAALKFGAGATVDFCVKREVQPNTTDIDMGAMEVQPDTTDIDMGAMEAAAVVTHILQKVKEDEGEYWYKP